MKSTAFNQGKKDAMDIEKTFQHNPYPYGSEEYVDWLRGFIFASKEVIEEDLEEELLIEDCW